MDSYRLVKVHWIDSGTSIQGGWTDISRLPEKAELAEVMTVGWLAYESDQVVALVQTYDPENEAFFNAQAIWKKAITKIEDL